MENFKSNVTLSILTWCILINDGQKFVLKDKSQEIIDYVTKKTEVTISEKELADYLYEMLPFIHMFLSAYCQFPNEVQVRPWIKFVKSDNVDPAELIKSFK